MSGGDERKLRPEDLVDLEMVAASLEDAGERGASALQKQARKAVSRSRLEVDRAPEKALAMMLRLSEISGKSSPGKRLSRAYARLRTAFVAVGVVLGVVTTTGVLVYDGARPVNVLSFLSVLIGAQLLLLLLLILGLALGRRVDSAVPALGWLRSFVSEMRRKLARRLAVASGESPSSGEDLPPVAEESLYAGIDRWRSVALLQWLAIGFNVGIAVALIGRLAVTDVVFGWSTTFGSVASFFPSLVEALAIPWKGWLPAAVPDPSIVETTRFIRIGGGQIAWAGATPSPDQLLYSGWWPFLLASVITYGLVPRLLMLAFANVMVRVRLKWAIEQSRRLERLRARMSEPFVEVVAEPAEGSDETSTERTPAEGGAPTAGEALEPAPSPTQREDAGDLGACSLVLWGDLPSAGEKLSAALNSQLGASVSELVQAGGLSFEETQRAIEKLNSGTAARLPVVLVAEAYEAPAEELERFIQAIRKGGDGSRVVVVALVDVLEADGWTEADPEDAKMWNRGLRRLPGVGAHLLGPVRLTAPGEAS